MPLVSDQTADIVFAVPLAIAVLIFIGSMLKEHFKDKH